MDLRRSNIKTFFVAAFFGLSVAAEGDPAALGAPVGNGIAAASVARPPRASSSEAAAPPLPPPTANGCGSDEMILVEGESCPDAEQVCLRFIDPPPYQNLRCAEYAKPAKCKGARIARRFCIDREEAAEPFADAGDAMPVVSKSWTEAKAACESRGARLCKEAEWEFACEGPEMSPYPYGWKRDASICNFDKTGLGGPMEKLNDLRAPLSAYPACLSPFGVHDMVGNVDEWVEREGAAAPNRSALRGGWWLPGRNRCRASTFAHGEDYSGKQVGYRCCADALPRTDP